MNPNLNTSSLFVADISIAVMRHTVAFTRSLSVGLLVSASCLVSAETETKTGPWVSLFNGRDLTGWEIVSLTDPAPAVVEDGVMVLRQRINTKEHTFVTSVQDYKDFILELDLMDDPGFNSGILLRCTERNPFEKNSHHQRPTGTLYPADGLATASRAFRSWQV